MHHVAVHVGEAMVPAGVAIREPLVINGEPHGPWGKKFHQIPGKARAQAAAIVGTNEHYA